MSPDMPYENEDEQLDMRSFLMKSAKYYPIHVVYDAPPDPCNVKKNHDPF